MRGVRTRFAPSPTGSLHVGGARTALFCYLFAKKNNGVFVLRIEDTDVARSTKVSEDVIVRDLEWLGIKWDEGPVAGGSFGPYRQSERLDYYQDALRKLLEKNLVYRCYCLEEELSARRKTALSTGDVLGYDGRCRNLSEEQMQEFKAQGRSFAWRFRIPDLPEPVCVHDLIRGDVHFEAGLIGDFVLVKSNGLPSYNFACVVDDHAMQISHVIRGEEHLTNTPRQVMLYNALGWDVPEFAHLSMILAPDHTKLSKRHGTTAVAEFKEKGYLPHAIINYISLLGWSPKDEREIFLPEKDYSSSEEALGALLCELAGGFSLEGVSKNPAVFDLQKLTWMNSQYIRFLKPEDLLKSWEDLGDALLQVPLHKDAILKIIETEKDDLKTLTDIGKVLSEFFLPGTFDAMTIEQLEEPAREVLQWEWSQEVLAAFEEELKRIDELKSENVSPLIKNVQKASGKKGKDLYWPIRVAVTKKTHGPELAHLFPVLGKSEILSRLQKTRGWFSSPAAPKAKR